MSPFDVVLQVATLTAAGMAVVGGLFAAWRYLRGPRLELGQRPTVEHVARRPMKLQVLLVGADQESAAFEEAGVIVGGVIRIAVRNVGHAPAAQCYANLAIDPRHERLPPFSLLRHEDPGHLRTLLPGEEFVFEIPFTFQFPEAEEEHFGMRLRAWVVGSRGTAVGVELLLQPSIFEQHASLARVGVKRFMFSCAQRLPGKLRQLFVPDVTLWHVHSLRGRALNSEGSDYGMHIIAAQPRRVNRAESRRDEDVPSPPN